MGQGIQKLVAKGGRPSEQRLLLIGPPWGLMVEMAHNAGLANKE